MADASNAKSKIAGIWKSLDKENGQSLAEVTIKTDGDKLAGSVLLRGLVKNGNKIVQEFPMTDVMFDGKAFIFKLTFQEDNEKMVVDWEFLLRDGEEARFAVTKMNDKQVEDGPVFVMKRMKAN